MRGGGEREDRPRGQGGERAGGSDPLYQIARCEGGADRAGSRPAVAMAVRGVAGERAAGGASGDAAREGSAVGDAGETRPKRRARAAAADAAGLVPAGAL